MRRYFNGMDHTFRQSSRGDVAPGFASVFRDVDKAAVAASVDDTGLASRFNNVVNRIVILATCAFVCNRSATHILLGCIVAR